jgi:hypothetical protein
MLQNGTFSDILQKVKIRLDSFKFKKSIPPPPIHFIKCVVVNRAVSNVAILHSYSTCNK